MFQCLRCDSGPELAYASEPVSYTHLDVYKRQVVAPTEEEESADEKQTEEL